MGWLMKFLVTLVMAIEGRAFEQGSRKVLENMDLNILFHNNGVWVELWPYQNETHIDEMVHLFASRFKTMFTIFHTNAYKLFSAVSKYNRKNALGNPNFQLLGLYVEFPELTLYQVQSSLEAAELANNAFNGSVRGFMFADLPNSEPIVRNSLNIMKEANHTYQIGLSVNVAVCKGQQLPNLLHLFGNLDMFRVVIPFSESYHLIGADGVALNLEKVMYECQETLRKFRENVRMGFHVNWPDTDRMAYKRNQTELVRFWVVMSEISHRRNITMFIRGAFDGNAADSREIDNFNGWWTIDWKEKAHASDDAILFPTHTDRTYFSCVNDPNITRIKLMNESESKVDFDRNFVSVQFQNDIVQPPLTREALVPFAGAVSERFSRIFVMVIDDDDYDILDPRDTLSEGYELAEAIALWNIFSAGCNDSKAQKLEISLGFNLRLDVDEDFSLYEKSVVSLSVTANLINQMFLGTVANIVMVLPSVESAWEIRADQLKTLQRVVHSNGLNFTVVEQIHVLENATQFNEWKRYQYSYVDHMVIRYDVCTNDNLKIIADQGLGPIFYNIIDRFEKLNRNLQGDRAPGNRHKTGLWVDILENCYKLSVNRSETSLFWELLNKYAKEYNTNVLISPIISAEVPPYVGWWQVSSNGPYFTMTESSVYKPFVNQSSRKINHMTVALWAVALFLVAIIFSMVLWVGIRRANIRKPDIFIQEMRDFKQDTQLNKTTEGIELISCSVCLSYDTSLEIDANLFALDNQSTLGSGSIGKVVTAKIFKDGKMVSVAAKTICCTEAHDAGALRNLLMEIKVASYLGDHLNIAQLVGAYTTKASSGTVIAFFELCHLGSLMSFLRNRTQTRNMDEESSYLNLVDAENPERELYLKWAGEIADGMDYIGSKFIVHGDLATRNVLLNDKMVAKICDFGLSRRMENYQNYVKSTSEPLPWRWMAYESLTSLHFSVKSDVWSYGVTLWEIFSDAEVPYPGLNWTLGFVPELKQGMRLLPPDNTSTEMYDLMMSCWMISPEERPSFTEIKQKLTEIRCGLQVQPPGRVPVANKAQSPEYYNVTRQEATFNGDRS